MSVQFLGWRWPKWRRSLGYYISVFGLCLVLAVACGGGSEPETVASDSRVAMGTTLSARTLDPADAYEIFPGILLYNLGDRLYTYAPGTTELEPQLATEMPTVSADGLTDTIPLREGVTLHDGSAFNAEVMAFSIQRFMDNGGRPAFLLSEKIETVTATGEYELTLVLKQPFAALTALLTFWGVTPVPLDTYTIGEGQFRPEDFIGTGPYRLASFSSDVIKLDANPDYWGEAPGNDGIDIQIFSSPANLYNTFRSGGLDVAYQTLDPEQIAALEREADQGEWTVIEAGSTVVNYMSLNQKIAPFDDLNVRKAVAAMVDRNIINERAFQGQAEPLYSLIPKSFDVHEPVFETAYGDGDYEKAREFLTAAGITEANPLEFEIWYPTASTTRSVVANTLKEAIEANLAGLVSVQVSTAEAATLWENVEKGIYPSVLSNWYPDYFDPDNFVQPFLSCSEGSVETLCERGATQGNGSFYYSATANDLLAQQSAELDESLRNDLFKDLQQVMVVDVPYIPLWQNKDYVFAASGVGGVAVEPNQQFLLWQISK
ncbi:MAG: ABC transporter substrate-binding protein [Cyanobacteria bacterium P01_D01_bin.2]